MACFIVPGGEAVITTVVQKIVEKKEGKSGEGAGAAMTWGRRLGWLNKMLWGGTLLLALEHIWHGELTLTPPFLTAMQSAEETAVMLKEMATVGVAMAAAVTAVWGIIVLVAELKARALPRVKTAA